MTRLGVDARRLRRSRRAARRRSPTRTVLVSVMAANNEIGVLQPLAEIGAIAHERGALLHTDAAQAAGKIPIDVAALGIDLLSLTGAQVLRARRAPARCTCAGSKPKLHARAADRRRRARERPALRHAQRSRDRRPRRAAPRSAGRRCADEVRAAGGAARSAARRPARRGSTAFASTARWRTAAAAQPPRQLRRRRRRGAADGARRPRGVDRLRVQLRQPGAVARAAGHRRGRRSRRRLHPLRPGPLRPPTPTSTSPSSASRPWSRLRQRQTALAAVGVSAQCSVSSFQIHVMRHESPSPTARTQTTRSCSSDWRSGAVDTGGIVVDQVLADIETLNRAAFEGKYEVTAVSFHAYAHLADKYALLPHGASMGDATARSSSRTARAGATSGQGDAAIAIPGTLTTAYLTLRLYEPDFEYVVVPFDRDPAGRARRQGRRRAADPRRAADVCRRRAAEDRRSRRVVGRAHRRAAAAARRQHHPPRSRAGDDRQGLEDAARQHRLRAVAPRGGRRIRAAVRPRARSANGPTRSSACTSTT